MATFSMKLLVSAAAVLAVAGVARAQQAPQPQAQPQVQANPVCTRLEAQLQAFDRGNSDDARAAQVRKYEEAETNQQAEIDRQEATARRMGCQQNSFFVLFSGQQAQCAPVNAKIQQMRSNLEQIQSQLEQLRGPSEPDERNGQRRAILVALSQNNCGAQYQAAVASSQPRSGGLFDSLFGPKSVFTPDNQPGFAANGTYRTICVRTCDGYYYPISYAASPARFAEDEKACKQSCPASEVSLYMYRNPGETVDQAVSITGAPYTALPTAFRYRQTVDPNCSCRHQGESWSQALKNVEDNPEQGDILVNEQRAKQLSQPRVDAQGKPIKLDPRATARPDAKTQPVTAAPKAPAAAPASAPTAEASAKEAPDKPDPKRKVRTVGPTFITPKSPAAPANN